MITITLSPGEYAYLCRAVQRDVDEGEMVGQIGDDEHAEEEHAHACRMQRLLKKVEQEQVVPF